MAANILGVGISVRCDDPDFEDLGPNLDWAEALRVDFVEIPTLAMDLVADGRVLRDRARKVAACLKGRPFGITAHGPIGINLMDVPRRLPLHVAVLKASLEVAAELGARHYVMHAGISGEDPPLDASYARQREMLSEAGDLARQLDLTIVVENVFIAGRGLHAPLPSELAREIRALDHSHVAACLDFSHAFLHTKTRDADFISEANALAPAAKHLHVHDSFGRFPDVLTFSHAERLAFGQGDLHLPVGWGAIPWTELMRTCRFADGAIFNIELDRRYRSAAAETVAATRAMVAQVVAG